MIDFGMPLFKPTIQGVDLIPNRDSQMGQMQTLALHFAHTGAKLAHLMINQIGMIKRIVQLYFHLSSTILYARLSLLKSE